MEKKEIEIVLREGYIYDFHFKVWKLTRSELIQKINETGVEFEDMKDVNKFGFKNVPFEKALILKAISDENSSIFFIDEEKLVQ